MDEKESLIAVIDVLRDTVKNQKEHMKNMTKIYVATIVCYTIILCAMIGGFFWYESQFEITATTETTTTTTTTYDQEASGDNSSINNVHGDQINEEYNDNAVKKVGAE